MTVVTTSTASTATAYSNQRKIDRCSDGTLVALLDIGDSPPYLYPIYSKDNGQTWALVSGDSRVYVYNNNSTRNYALNHSMFIDLDDYIHVVYKNIQDGFIYYRRGTPNAARTAWTWSAATLVRNHIAYTHPDIAAHKEGSGWAVHIVCTATGATGYSVYYDRVSVSSSGTFTLQGAETLNATGYGVDVSKFPSIDFHHTGDGKTVKDGTPHLFAAWSAGATGAGKGIRFKKATYSGGSWAWGAEREIDNTLYIHDGAQNSWLNCLFDGTRVMLIGVCHSGSGYVGITYERDAADTTTTARATTILYSGSASYDSGGNLYWIGRSGAGTSGTHNLDVVKWTRATNSVSILSTLESTAPDLTYVSAKRGYSNNRIEFIYTDGTASPYSVTFGGIELWDYESPEFIYSGQTGTIDTTGLEAGQYEVQIATADAEGFGPYSDSVFFDVVIEQAATLNAVPAVLELNAPAGITTGIGQSIYAVPAVLELEAVPVALATGVGAPAAELQLDAQPGYIGGAATVYAVSAGIRLWRGGPITIYWNGLFAVPADMELNAAPPSLSVYIMPPRPTYTEAQYRAKFLAPQTNIIRRVEILQADGETIWDDTYGNKSRLISGSISVDAERDERRSLDLELANFDKALIVKPEGFWYDKILRVWRGIEFYDSSGRRTYEVPLGKFMMDRVAQPRFPNTVKITARDFTKKLLLSKLSEATGFTAGTSIEAIIAAMAGAGGVDDRILPATGVTITTDLFFERGKSRWECIKELANAHGYELFFNAQGYLEMRKYLDPTLSPVSHEFTTGPTTGNLVDWERASNDTRIYNHVSVIGADDDTIPVWADAFNNDPASPTRIDLIGQRTYPIESPLVTTFAQAQDLADTMLKVMGLEEYEINMSSLVFPWLEAGEIVRFTDPDPAQDDPTRFLLSTLTIPLGLAPMEAVGRRVMIVS